MINYTTMVFKYEFVTYIKKKTLYIKDDVNQYSKYIY